MQEWGLKNVHLEKWPFGYGWQIKHFYAAMETPVYVAFTRVPAGMDAWNERPAHGRAGVGAHPPPKQISPKYHGKLRGKALLMFDPAPLTLPHAAGRAALPNG